MNLLPDSRKESLRSGQCPASRGRGAGGELGRALARVRGRSDRVGGPRRVCVFLAERLLQPVPGESDRPRGALGQREELLRQCPGELLPAGRGPRAAGREARRRLRPQVPAPSGTWPVRPLLALPCLSFALVGCDRRRREPQRVATCAAPPRSRGRAFQHPSSPPRGPPGSSSSPDFHGHRSLLLFLRFTVSVRLPTQHSCVSALF